MASKSDATIVIDELRGFSLVTNPAPATSLNADRQLRRQVRPDVAERQQSGRIENDPAALIFIDDDFPDEVAQHAILTFELAA